MSEIESKRNAYTIKEFSSIYGVSRSFIYKEVARGNLEVRKAGRRTLILSSVADRWLQSLPFGVASKNGQHQEEGFASGASSFADPARPSSDAGGR